MKDHLNSQKHQDNLIHLRNQKEAEARHQQCIQETYSGDVQMDDNFSACPNGQHPGFLEDRNTILSGPFHTPTVEPFLDPSPSFDPQVERERLQQQVEKLLFDALHSEEDDLDSDTATNVEEILRAHGGEFDLVLALKYILTLEQLVWMRITLILLCFFKLLPLQTRVTIHHIPTKL
jgi:hypothetical protein